MLQIFLTAAAVVGLLFVDEGLAQCFATTGCTGEIVPATDLRSCCVDTDDGLSYSDGTTCTLCIVHGFLQATYDVNEDARLDTMFQLNVKGITPLSTLTITGTIAAAPDGTATNMDFEQLLPIRVSDSTAEIRLFISNDELTLETNDRVLLTFSPDNPELIGGVEGAGEFIRDIAIVNIIDNDLLQINFGESDYSIEEGTNMLSTSITLQFRASQRDFSVTLCPVTVNTAETEGLGNFINADTITNESRATAVADFSTSKTTVTIPANTRTFQVSQFFMIVDDNIDEDEQSFAIIAEIESDVPDAVACFQIEEGQTDCFGRRGATEIRITDNDLMVIGFNERSQTVSEGEIPTVDIFFILLDVSNIRTAERVHTMTFRYQEASSTAIVEPVIDQINPNFDALFGSRGLPTDPIEETIDLEPGEDTLPPRRVQIRNDFVPEPNECFSIRIFTVDVIGRRELFTCNEDNTGATSFFCEHTVCIIDDDDPFVVAFVDTMYTVDESMGSVSVCVNLTQPLIDILDETVNVFVMDNPSSIYIPADAPLATPDPPDFLSRYAMIEGSDYAQQTSAVNAIDDTLITELMRIVCYSQPIYDDLRLELDEFAGLSLGVKDNELTTVLTTVQPLYDQASILIVDNDRAVVGLEQTFFRVEENVGFIQICVNVSFPEINCPIAFPFEVLLSTADGTAVQATDYQPLDVTLMFEACQTRRCVDVEIIDDTVEEPEEVFTYTLRRTPDLDARIELNPVDGQVEIVDDDLDITVGYNPVLYTTSEGIGVVELTIQVFSHPIGGTPIPFNLVVSTQDGTALAGAPDMDYVAVNGEIIQFNMGDSVQTHRIIINDDLICENLPNEFFFSNIALESAALLLVTVVQPQATIFIDDAAEAECADIRVGYERTVYTTPEGDTFVELCVILYEPDVGGPVPRPFTLSYQTADGSALSGIDYVPSTGELVFVTGDTRQCHSVQILEDDVCELPEQEFFFSRLTLDSGRQVIVVQPEEARVIIDDTADCPSGVFVNDTVTGDPLMTVPISSVDADNVESLCYEIHGEENAFFNLISDECTSVNSYYQRAVAPPSNLNLNVITQIGVRARGTNTCWNIQVDLDTCSAMVDGAPPTSGGSFDGITVRSYPSSSRVRISVPNCADSMLVMWVFCRDGQVEDPTTMEFNNFRFIRLVVRRGLNLNEQSHGLIGQFWNVPVTISSYTGLVGGEQMSNDYVITVDHPNSPPRSFLGIKYNITWEHEARVCYYAGNSQAGKVAGDPTVNDPVIEGSYRDYKVDSLFATDFKYSHFDESRC